MLSKRNAPQNNPIIDQLINYLRIQDYSFQQQIQKRINKSYLQKYFIDIHRYINPSNLCHVQAYETLSDGLYILLKGQIRLFFNDKCDKLKKSQKSKQLSTAVINRSWCVFESICKNCTCSQQSYLLRISQQQAIQTKFYQLFATRNQLYSNHYLSQDHRQLYQFQEKKVINVNVRIHSNFQFKSYFFREIICLQSPAIISKGRAKLKYRNISSHEFDRFGVLLPHLKYEVTSSQVQLMIIRDNETLSYHLQQIHPHLSPQCSKITMNSMHSTSVSTPKHVQHDKSLLLSKREKQKRSKELGKLFKVSEPYSVISTFLCKKNLSFAKNYNLMHETKRRKQNGYKNPLVLFNIANQKSKMVIPDFCDISNITDDNNKTISFQKVSTENEAKSAFLRKIRLQPAEYDRIIKKHKQNNSYAIKQNRCIKRSMDFTMDKLQFSVSRGEVQPIQPQQFVPYAKY